MKWGECWKKNGVLFAKKEHKEEIMKKTASIFSVNDADSLAAAAAALKEV